MELHAHPELTPAWRQIAAELRRVVGDSTYELWLAPLKPKFWDGTTLTLEAPPDTCTWVPKRFGHVLQRSVCKVLGPTVRAEVLGPEAATAKTDVRSEPLDDFNPRYTFNQFVIGSGNQMAHAAALAVAELPGQAYNPLFIHAPPGLGKTHLLHAIANYQLAFGGHAAVRYTTAETFTNHFLTALASRSLSSFKRAHRDVDILLIDDVQFLASKAKTEEEFFHTFNALYDAGRQLVISSDRVPTELSAVEDRLRERFQAGLVVAIDPPDFSTRLAILRKRAELDGIAIADPEVLELIAARVTTNVRALEGALIRIVASHSLTRRPIDSQLAAAVLNHSVPAPASPPPSVERIQQAVAAHFGLSRAELCSPSRATHIAWPRQVAIHLAREITAASLQELGDAFGGRNHTTIIHACRRVQERLRHDSSAVAELRALKWRIRSEQGDRIC